MRLSDYFKKFRGKFSLIAETGNVTEETIILQLQVNDEGRFVLFDSHNHIFLNYGEEKTTLEGLKEQLVEASFDESNLQNSFVSVGGFVFVYHWNK